MAVGRGQVLFPISSQKCHYLLLSATKRTGDDCAQLSPEPKLTPDPRPESPTKFYPSFTLEVFTENMQRTNCLLDFKGGPGGNSKGGFYVLSLRQFLID